jgi:hypothetical protein
MSEDEFRFLSLRRMPARLVVEEVAWLLHCTAEDVHALTRAGLIKPLGDPPANGKKHYHTRKLLEAVEDPVWLAKVTNAIYRRWKVKNASRTHSATRLPGQNLFDTAA